MTNHVSEILLSRIPAASSRSLYESGAPEADEAEGSLTKAERRAKLQQHLIAALSTAIVPCQPMISRSTTAFRSTAAVEPGDDSIEDAAYWDLVCALRQFGELDCITF